MFPSHDLDGVLVDTSHRYRNKPDGTIDLDYWFANRTPEKIAQDKLLPLVSQYRDDVKNPSIYTIICTSRAEYKHDKNFIRNILGWPNKLIMRPAGNMEPDGILKRKALSRLFSLRQFQPLIKFFWEDNIKNIKATEHLFTKTFLIKSEICERD